MKLKLNYAVIPLAVIATSLIGSSVTSGNMSWYKTLVLPPIAPPGGFIGLVWTVIFILTAISILLFWNKEKKPKNKRLIGELFVLNGALNVFWSAVFFGQHLLGWAIVEMIVLNITNLVLIIWLWRNKYRASSILLWPYFGWVCFATFLASWIWVLNK